MLMICVVTMMICDLNCKVKSQSLLLAGSEVKEEDGVTKRSAISDLDDDDAIYCSSW